MAEPDEGGAGLDGGSAGSGAMQTGIVKTWLDERGMGFITPEGSTDDVFVHRRDLLDGQMLEVGSQVTFIEDWDLSKNKRIAKQVAGAVEKPASKGGSGYVPARPVSKGPAGAGGPGAGGAGGAPPPSDNVWVGDLPPDMQKQQLGDIFAAYGSVVECRLIPPKQPGQNACGLVRFGSVQEATWVVHNLNGNIPKGLDAPIVIKFAAASAASGSGGPAVWKPLGKGAAAPALGGGGGGGGWQNGSVKSWMEERGMGFITADNGGDDVFVHRSHIQDGQMLEPGARVTFQEDWDPVKNKRVAKTVISAGHSVGKGAAGSKGYALSEAGGKGAPPSNNIFVGDLPIETDKAKLQSIFESYGVVMDCRTLPPKQPGQKMCGLVRFSSESEASWVVDNLNGNIPHGLDTPIIVRFANKPGGSTGASWEPPPPAPGLTPRGGAARPSPYAAAFKGSKGPPDSGGKGHEAPPSDNLWVGDLPPETDQAQLGSIFEAYGVVVECRMLPQKQPGQKGCGLVRFATEAEASWVVDNLNGNIPHGLDTPIVVRFANKPGGSTGASGQPPLPAGGHAPPGGLTPRGGAARPSPYAAALKGSKGPPDSGGKGKEAPPSDNLWVGDLPPETDQAQLGSIFEAYGVVVECRILPQKQPGQKGCGLVRFATEAEASWVVDNLNGNIPHGLDTPVVVRFANKPGGSTGNSWQPPPPAGLGPHGVRSSPYAAATNGGKGGYGGSSAKGKVGSPASRPGMARSIRALYDGVRGAGILGEVKAPEDCQVYVKNLPPDTTDLDLYKLFSPFGAIGAGGVKVMTHEDGSCKGFGFVNFAEAVSAMLAVSSLNGFVCADGGSLSVSQKQSRNEAPASEASTAPAGAPPE